MIVPVGCRLHSDHVRVHTQWTVSVNQEFKEWSAEHCKGKMAFCPLTNSHGDIGETKPHVFFYDSDDALLYKMTFHG